MGTRNLTMVIQDHETKISQYGQWDGYPEGQSLTILSFLQEKEKHYFRKYASRTSKTSKKKKNFQNQSEPEKVG